MSTLDRRTVLRVAAAGSLLGVTAGCTTDDAPTVASPTPTDAVGTGPQTPGSPPPSPSAVPTPPVDADALATAEDFISDASFDALTDCTPTPRSTAGPFPNREEMVRSDIRDGRPGHPMVLALRVIDPTCEPVEGAQVAVWHTDHTGDYSDYDDGGSGKDEGPGTTFCRGTQPTDAAGIARFTSIVPGWYDGRAVHLHLEVLAPDGRQLTTQAYFEEAYTSEILATGVYAEFGPPDVPVSRDGLAGDPAADGTQLWTHPVDVDGEAGTVALLSLVLPAST